ncbi:hypothetical protein [Aliarcobacter skirrowii]|uniref:hypothetical protein n=1 Tax=Aliarcobacter skirrowii TaxID=28200 RepID=UPI0014029F74
MCTVLKVHPSGYYKWLKQLISNLEIENQQILQEIKKAYKESNISKKYLLANVL